MTIIKVVHMSYVLSLFRTRLLLCLWSVLMLNITFLSHHFRSMMMVMELLMMSKATIPMITAIALKHKGKSPDLL